MYTKGLFNYLTCSSHDILCPVAPCFAIVLENTSHLHVICNDLCNDFQLLNIHWFTFFPSFHLNQEKLEHLRWKIAGQLYQAFVAPVGAPPRRGE